MADENNADELSAQLKEITEKLKERGFESVDKLLEDRDAISETLKKEKDIFDNAQKVIQKQGAELGDLRKKVTTESPATGNKQEPSASVQKEETVEEIESSMTEEQKKVADEAYKKATPEEKVEFANNPEARKRLLKFAKQTIISAPESLWSKPSTVNVSQNATEDRIRELFGKQKEINSYTPPGSKTRGYSGSANVDDEEKVKSRPVGGHGVLQAIKDRKE